MGNSTSVATNSASDRATESRSSFAKFGIDKSSNRLFPLDSAEEGAASTLIAVNGWVYDVQGFLDRHPGGAQVLIDSKGMDATEEFEAAYHSQHAREMMEQFKVGKLVDSDVEDVQSKELPILILYGTQTGNAKKLAWKCRSILSQNMKDGNNVRVLGMDEFDPEDMAKEKVIIILTSTFSAGEPPKNAKFFFDWLKEAVHDFRVGKEFLAETFYAVFGLGNSLYEDHYNVVGKQIDEWCSQLGGRRICEMGEGDSQFDTYEQLEKWFSGNKSNFLQAINGDLSAKAIITPPVEEADDDANYESEEEEEDESGENLVQDLEDLGDTYSNNSHVGSTEGRSKEEGLVEITNRRRRKKGTLDTNSTEKRTEMVTPAIRESLTKQGYKIIGSHSGVKICRWTKAMLRGRGGCYKHTFYGITSYKCMEMTPSLACANKCVFCWRHHTNPVGKEWRWFVDEPEMILEGAISNHKQMIKQMKGVPGVKPDRYEDAFNIRHCALSLVGEPIMYPHINRFVGMLHERQISSFLVTNAQFPDTIENLSPVTQLYVSIDASTKDSLKSVDRPLFKDFWERFIDSLKNLSRKKQRTVFRVTLVKGMNMAEIREYAKLVAIGLPEFIEVKGVTFCGSSNASDLTMKNVPFHEEVRAFCESLCLAIEEMGISKRYELACEHVHSCCILISETKFKIDGKWHTWIDYPKFHELVNSGSEFSSLDYMAETPDWAVYGHERGGFDPEETRFYRKGGAKKA